MTGQMLETMARAGYLARGAVYCLVGWLALLAAIGTGGDAGGNESALSTLISQPFGWVLLGVIALGLLCHSAWRLIDGIVDADHRGNSAKALAIRGGYLISSFASFGLAVTTINLVMTGARSSGGDDQSAQDWTAWLLSQPFGQILVALVGLAVIGAGFAFVRKGWRGDVTKHLSLTGTASRWVKPLGRTGYVARGVVFFLIGGFLLVAALHSSSSEAMGLGGALKTLEAQPYGWVLLGLTAFGLFAFGIFGMAQARYRRINAPDADHVKRTAARHMDALRS